MTMFTKLGRLAAEVTGRLRDHLVPERDTCGKVVDGWKCIRDLHHPGPCGSIALDGLRADTMPHCDSAVLHAPGVCEYCDQYPSWQRAREMARVGFTGDAPRPGWLPCPSTFHRPLTVINQWPGNQPSPKLVPRPDQQLPPGDDQP